MLEIDDGKVVSCNACSSRKAEQTTAWVAHAACWKQWAKRCRAGVGTCLTCLVPIISQPFALTGNNYTGNHYTWKQKKRAKKRGEHERRIAVEMAAARHRRQWRMDAALRAEAAETIARKKREAQQERRRIQGLSALLATLLAMLFCGLFLSFTKSALYLRHVGNSMPAGM